MPQMLSQNAKYAAFGALCAFWALCRLHLAESENAQSGKIQLFFLSPPVVITKNNPSFDIIVFAR